MEEVLIDLGINKNTINQMLEICPDLEELNKEEIIRKIEILKNVKCDDFQIKSIIISNPRYLNRSDSDIRKLISKFEEYGFKNLDLLFDGNPYILNLDAFELNEYIIKRQESGELLEDIIEDMNANLNLFFEIWRRLRIWKN